MEFSVIAAVNRRGGIGAGGIIPWVCQEDTAHFRARTFGGTVIMGRITWESIGKPLAGRNTIVITSLKDAPEGVTFCDSLASALACACTVASSDKRSHVWVAGGRQLYEEALVHPLCMSAVVTEIDDESECDVAFPCTLLASRWETRATTSLCERARVVTYEPLDRIHEHAYLEIGRSLLSAPIAPNRTGVPARSVFAAHLRFSLAGGTVPLLTTKRVPWRVVYAELLWFLRGQTHISALHRHGVHIWDANATREYLDSRGLADYPEGELGPIYGSQWRRWGAPSHEHDQIARLVAGLRADPFGRRHIVSAWNVADLDKMALPPCHCLFQFVVHANADGAPAALSCVLHQRSGDYFLGVPFNIASYSILAHMIGHLVGLPAREFVVNIADCHLYTNHEAAMTTQLSRRPRGPPRIRFTKTHQCVDEFDETSIEIDGYYPQSTIAAAMAV
jgi:thymidylate synthase